MKVRIFLACWVASVCLVGSSSNLAAGDDGSRKPLDAETLWRLERLGPPTLSPDGRLAAVPVTRYEADKDEGDTDIWVVPTDGGEARRFTTHASRDDAAVWSPDGKLIAFVAKRDDDEENQIYLLPADGGEARRLTEVPTGASAPKWFPDSQRLLFMTRVWNDLETWEAQKERMKERKDSKVSAKVWDKPTIRWWDHWIDDREAHVYAIDVDGGEPMPVTRGTGLQLSRNNPGASSFDISPDGEELAFAANIDKTGVDDNFDIFVIPVSGGEPRNLSAENPGDDDRPLYSPDGRSIAYVRQVIKGFYADKLRLMLYDRKSGETTYVTEVWDRSASGLVWAPDSKSLYGAIDDAGTRRVYRIDIRGRVPRAITDRYSFASLVVRGRRPVMVGLRQSFLEPPTLVRIDPRGGEVVKLSTFNDAILAGVDFGTYESVTYEGMNGDEIQMWINYPPGFDSEKKWPLYLLLHGGPHNAVPDSFHWRWNAQVFSGWGYVTTWHNFHGSSGFGQAFTDSINPNRADLPYGDTIKASEYLARKPWIDTDRMAAGGGSYGGYLASIILGRAHPFKTLIAHAAVYNIITQYGADYGAYKRRHGEHWVSPEIIKLTSPHLGAGHFNTPTLVIHGQNDYRVPLNHGIELFNTLQNRGVRSRLIYYPDENHFVQKRENSIFWYNAKKEWLQEYIGE